MSPTLTEVQQYGSLIPVMWVDMDTKKGFFDFYTTLASVIYLSGGDANMQVRFLA